MAGNKYLERNASTGLVSEKVSADLSAGAADAGRVVALNAAGEIDVSMLPTVDSVTIEAGEDLAAYDMVEIYDDAGTAKARKASAASGTPRPAMAFTKTAILTGVSGKAYLEGVLTAAGLTPGARQYLSETPGVFTAVPINGVGKLHQFIGRATSPTGVDFDPDDHILLA